MLGLREDSGQELFTQVHHFVHIPAATQATTFDPAYRHSGVSVRVGSDWTQIAYTNRFPPAPYVREQQVTPSEFFAISALDREPMTSYAGNQEDVRLRRVAGFLEGTTYVDVGAGHPVDGSVTYWLYTQGWRGVLVEPGLRSSELIALRPEDRAIVAAVGRASGELTLFETTPDPGMSTVRRDRLEELTELGQVWHERKISVLTLTQVFDSLPEGTPVGLLSVDVEGYEAEVLSSLDWRKYRPQVLVVEAVEPWRTVPTHHEFEPILDSAGYEFAAFDGVNRYYVDGALPAAQELKKMLEYPVSLLDRWTPYSSSQAQFEASMLRDQKEELKNELTRAQGQLEEAQAEWSEAAAREQALRRDREDHASRLRQVSAMLQHQQEVAAALQAELEQVRAAHEQVIASRTWRYVSPVAHRLRSTLAPAVRLKRAIDDPRVTGRDIGQRSRQTFLSLRARLSGPEERLRLLVARQTHPAFLAGPEPLSEALARDWSGEAEAVLGDTDDGLRSRLESRDGIRPDWQRQVQVAALAQEVRRSGKAHPRGKGAGRDMVVVDARSLQDPSLANRGVGQYAAQFLRSVREEVGDNVLLFVDEALAPLPEEFGSWRSASTLPRGTLGRVAWFVETSPLTHDSWPLTGLLNDAQIWCTTLLYDFIPLSYPDAYLPREQDRVAFAARAAALELYDEIWPISNATMAEARAGGLGLDAERTCTVWPDFVSDTERAAPLPVSGLPQEYVLIAAGNEKRKNVVAALAALASVRQSRPSLNAVILGCPGASEQIMEWSADVGLDRSAVVVLPRISDGEASALRQHAAATLVPSFAEGLSLPVIESIVDGCPVAVSDIPAHLELTGPGSWVGQPTDPTDLARALKNVLSRPDETLADQRAALDAHDHLTLAAAVRQSPGFRHRRDGASASRPIVPGRRPSLGVVTPWPPQPTGVGDYSAFTLGPLETEVDLTLYLSGQKRTNFSGSRPATMADPSLNNHDVLLTVLGNSHFHLPGLEIIEGYGGVALCHDVRMAELNTYLGLEDRDSREPLLPSSRVTRHELDALPTLGFEHVAARCELLLFHSQRTAERVHSETGGRTAALPFVPYRLPGNVPRGLVRQDARETLSLAAGQLHIGLLGGVDLRTKASDVALEALAWLRDWGVEAILHVVGEVERPVRSALEHQASSSGVAEHVRWHGRVEEQVYSAFLSGLDVGMQLRSAELLSLSGAAADLAAYGIPTVVTRSMSEDMGLPAYVLPVENDFSPLTVAEQILRAADLDPLGPETEEQRREYVESHSVEKYRRQLLEALGIEAS